ncbi:MAG: sigma-70 family RNA polymerase sigma factor [Calditrichae bacterium]|nr:sigma-70 family RNA polymerase sigma factor [Calditrichota bacterium]MCB0316510.1 sigma-70 family RNA polymerase sigma factor [Calditrichota bacterium]MCB9089000.1 sigma-70 family RNA polymerase sigma factor [Calditrichia bacterium]
MDNHELELIRRARQGSVEAFDQLVRLHDRQVLQMIRNIVGNLDDAYDVYQETFIRAYHKLASFRFESELSTWLGRIAINLSISWRKRQRRRQWLTLEPVNNDAVYGKNTEGDAQPDEGAEGLMMNRELRAEILREVNRLPEQQRTVFILKHFQGLKIREIADMMDCAEGTVKNHLFRATQKLQKSLTAYAQP